MEDISIGSPEMRTVASILTGITQPNSLETQAMTVREKYLQKKGVCSGYFFS